nr:lipoprotein [uncultured Capnocytophaga sp.]
MKRILTLLLLAFALSSCNRLFVKLYNTRPIIDKKVTWRGEDREVIFIPMIHISRQAYYDQVKDFVTQKRQEGYTIYYEGVGMSDSLTAAQRDTVYRKARKILGFHIKGAYDKDGKNRSIPKYKRYVGQNKANTGIDTIRDINLDMTLDKLLPLVATVGGNDGKIELDECDYSTPLNAKYKCKKPKNWIEYRYALSHTYRDNYIKETLIKAPHKKIVIVYGGGHKDAIGEAMKELKLEKVK